MFEEQLNDDMFDKIDTTNALSEVWEILESTDTGKRLNVLSSYTITDNSIVLGSSVDTKTFLSNDFSNICIYLKERTIEKITRNNYCPARITSLTIDKNGMIQVIDKSIWLRLIQRKWKKVFKDFKSLIQQSHSFLHHREVYGQFPEKLNLKKIKIRGLMNNYSNILSIL